MKNIFRKLALVGIIPNLFSFRSDKDRRTDSRIRRKNLLSAAPPGIEPRVLRIPVARSPGWDRVNGKKLSHVKATEMDVLKLQWKS